MALTLGRPELLRTQAFIDGLWLDGGSDGLSEVRNPADGTLVATVPCLGADGARHAIAAAERAFDSWRARPAAERSRLLRCWAMAVGDHREDLATILTAEQGKPLAEARGEIDYAAAFLDWFGDEARRVYGETIPAPSAAQRIIVQKQPVGVCAAITPWNFPAAMITRKVGPALAVGCTMVVKPAPATPLTALALAFLAECSGIPPGVINVVPGDAAAIGDEFLANPIVRKLSFTGSTAVGKHLLARAAHTVKKCSMELGGNAPFIVFDDADIDAALRGLMAAKFRNAGQTCVSPNRVFVQDSIYDAFARRVVERTRALKVGYGKDPASEIGPLIDQAAVIKLSGLVDEAVASGAELMTGGAQHALGGNFYEPTVLSGISTSMRIANEEAFGPVIPLLPFRNETDVVRMANGTNSGLAAYFYSRDYSRIVRVAEALETGMVGVNESAISTEVAPFGGIKESGLGREGSRHGTDDYLEMKYLLIGNIQAA